MKFIGFLLLLIVVCLGAVKAQDQQLPSSNRWAKMIPLKPMLPILTAN